MDHAREQRCALRVPSITLTFLNLAYSHILCENLISGLTHTRTRVRAPARSGRGGEQALFACESRDRTIYGETRISTRSFYMHHVQRIVRNVVYYGALNIIEQIGCLKQHAYDAA